MKVMTHDRVLLAHCSHYSLKEYHRLIGKMNQRIHDNEPNAIEEAITFIENHSDPWAIGLLAKSIRKHQEVILKTEYKHILLEAIVKTYSQLIDIPNLDCNFQVVYEHLRCIWRTAKTLAVIDNLLDEEKETIRQILSELDPMLTDESMLEERGNIIGSLRKLLI